MNDTEEAIRESLDRIVPRRQDAPEWEDVLSRLESHATPRADRPARVSMPWRLRLVATGVLVAAAAAVALLVVAPWRGGPSVIARASAAITAPSPSQVIYEKATIAPFFPVCLHGPKPGGPCRTPATEIELWVEGGSGSRSFRAITRESLPKGITGVVEVPAAPFGNALARHTGPVLVTEIGGSLGPTHVDEALVYQRYSNTLIRFTQAPTAISSDSFDPVALVRHALAAGNARAAGTTTIDRRRLRIIQVRMRDDDGYEGTATYYADATTYAPVRIVYHHSDFLQFPYTPVFDSSNPSDVTVDFSTFDRAAATKTTRALTEIRAHHETAKVVCGVEFGLPDC